MNTPASPSSENQSVPREYWCFISYRHSDNKEPGRQWATWLHQALETYEVPAELVGKKNELGQVIPERIYPVFRDEEELPADAELSRPIENALARSRYLVVLCSPGAVASRFVAEEILRFKQLGKPGAILAAILTGEPNASEDAAKGTNLECFPRPLRYKVDVAGQLTSERVEPIAADFRLPNGDLGWTTPAAYREQLQQQAQLPRAEINARVAAYGEQLHRMLLKIIAGLLGIPLGELTRRDQAYQLALQKRRTKVLRRWLSAVTVLSLVAIAAGCLAYLNSINFRQQRDIADQKAIESRGRLVRMMFERAKSELGSRNWLGALPWMLEGARLDGEQPTPMSRLHQARLSGILATCPQLAQVVFHEDSVQQVSFSADGKYFVTASADYTARVWEADSGRPVGASMEHDDPVQHAEFSPDGRFVVTAAGDTTGRRGAGSVRVWNATTGKPVTAPLPHAGISKKEAGVEGQKGTPRSDYVIPHGGAVTLARFSPDGRRIASAGDDMAARVWNAADGQPVGKPLMHSDNVTTVAFSPDGKLLATGDKQGHFHLWDTNTGQELPLRREQADARSQSANAVEFSANGKLLVTSGGQVSLWNVEDRHLLYQIPIEPAWKGRYATFGPEGKFLAVQTADDALRFWNLAKRNWEGDPFKHDQLSHFSFSASGRLLATVGAGVRVWDTSKHVPITSILPYGSRVASFSPDESKLAAGGSDRAAQLWKIPYPTVFTFASGEGTQLNFHGEMKCSPNGALAFAYDEQQGRIWNTVTGAPASSAIRVAGVIQKAEFSHQGRWLAIVYQADEENSERHRVSLWDMSRSTAIPVQLEHDKQVLDVRFSPDEKWLAAAGPDGSIHLSNTVDGTALVTLRHDFPVLTLAFAADGRKLAAGCGHKNTFDTQHNGYAQVWQLPEGKPVGPRLSAKGWIERVHLGEDDKILVTHGAYPLRGGGAIFPDLFAIWDVPSGQPLLGPQKSQDDQEVRKIGTQLSGEKGALQLLRRVNDRQIFSEDGTLFAEVQADEIKLRSATNGQVLPTLPISVRAADAMDFKAIAFSPDRALLAVLGKGADSHASTQLGIWDVATGDRFLPDTPLPIQGVIRRILFSNDSSRLQVECGSSVWQVPLDRDLAKKPLAEFEREIELTTGVTIDRERDGALIPIDLKKVWDKHHPRIAPLSVDLSERNLHLARLSMAESNHFATARQLDRLIASRLGTPTEWYLMRASAHLKIDRDSDAQRDAEMARQSADNLIDALPEVARPAARQSEGYQIVLAQTCAIAGAVAYKQGRWQEAAQNLELATASRNADSQWFLPLAVSYAELGERKRAVDALVQYDPEGVDQGLEDELDRFEQAKRRQGQLLMWDYFILVNPTWTRHGLEASELAYARRGLVQFRDEQWEDAINDFDTAIDEGATEAWVWKFRAAAYQHLGECKQALNDCDQAIAAATEVDTDVLLLRSRLRRRTGDISGAIQDAANAIESAPQLASAWLARGQARTEQDDISAAIYDLNQAVRLSQRKDAATLLARARALQLAQRFTNALSDATAALELSPRKAAAWLQRAELLEEMERFDEALEDVNKALALEAASVDALLCYARCLRELGNAPKALEPLVQAARLDPTNDLPWHETAETHRALRQWKEALSAITRAIELAPQDAWNFHLRADCHAELRDWKAALRDMQQAAELDPAEVEHASDLVFLLHAAGQGDEGRQRAADIVKTFMADDSSWGDVATAFETVLPVHPAAVDFAALRKRLLAERPRPREVEIFLAVCDAETQRHEAAASRLEDVLLGSKQQRSEWIEVYLQFSYAQLGKPDLAKSHAVALARQLQSLERDNAAGHAWKDRIAIELLARRLNCPLPSAAAPLEK